MALLQRESSSLEWRCQGVRCYQHLLYSDFKLNAADYTEAQAKWFGRLYGHLIFLLDISADDAYAR